MCITNLYNCSRVLHFTYLYTGYVADRILVIGNIIVKNTGGSRGDILLYNFVVKNVFGQYLYPI